MLIFGRTWEEIQDLQKKTGKVRIATGGKPTASQADIDMLKEKGIDYIKGNLLFGVIDRLETSGIIPKDDI